MEKYIQYSENRQKENLLAINAHEVLEEKKLHDFSFKRLWSFNKNMELLFLQRYCIDIFRKTLNNIDGLRIFSRQPNSPLFILPHPWIFVEVNTKKAVEDIIVYCKILYGIIVDGNSIINSLKINLFEQEIFGWCSWFNFNSNLLSLFESILRVLTN